MINLFWHRRDLRLKDNAGLHKALRSNLPIQSVFIFDSNILQELPKDDQRVIFIHREVSRLKKEYQAYGSDLIVRFGDPKLILPQLVNELNAQSVYTNRDYEPYALVRDKGIYETLQRKGKTLIGSKDHVIFEKDEIVKNDGLPYTVFTPYSRKWKEKLNEFYLSSYPSEKYLSRLNQIQAEELIQLKDIGFSDLQTQEFPSINFPEKIISTYDETRDIPSINGTSKLSIHLRFGTISIRELCRLALRENPTYLNELIWRDFYQMIIFNFPHSAKDSFKKQYDAIIWEQNEDHYRLWCEGKTGYPLVDAGMRELNATGFMHNRVRMVVASFLSKHLLLDWRLGEAYFALKLHDFELASNMGGWQWAAGCGCDAAPYFRVFNPTSQQEKFDKDFKYIKKWVPEFGSSTYSTPTIEHKFARERAIKRYKETLSNVQ
jgi:deoxyribodipyrimidine photo-lyase